MCFEKYQTFIVGILGFGGVMFTIYMNARLSRVQHNLQINHEREALRTAIYSELELIRKMFEGRCDMAQEKGGLQSAFYPEHISNQVYLQFINRIGLLSASEIEAVMEAYALVSDLPIRLQLLSTDHDPSFDRPGYIYIDSEYAETAIGIHKSFLPKIELAIKKLKDSLNN
jgi:hypothetical protein